MLCHPDAMQAPAPDSSLLSGMPVSRMIAIPDRQDNTIIVPILAKK